MSPRIQYNSGMSYLWVILLNIVLTVSYLIGIVSTYMAVYAYDYTISEAVAVGVAAMIVSVPVLGVILVSLPDVLSI